MHLTIHSKTLIYDLLTPVHLYLNLRDEFNNSLLLESVDQHSKENSLSYICLQSLASFVVDKDHIEITKESDIKRTKIKKNADVIDHLQTFIQSFSVDNAQEHLVKFFGHTAYDAIQYFENIDLNHVKNCIIPELAYHLFRFVIQIDHYNKTITLHEFLPDNESSELQKLEDLVKPMSTMTHPFSINEPETSNLNAEEFKHLVSKGKQHCKKGDVFQIVLSRQYAQKFKGDEFNVYRALRSINPSPYLFYFDYGDFKIFGSSPEAQLKIKDNKALLNPIAGTFKRTGNPKADQTLDDQLLQDPKENAEHNMLVDLARNDLSKHGSKVEVSKYKSIQYFSHVIHMVSEIQADIDPKDALNIFADTFPAGTLSGAPKYKALQLIDQYENQSRGFYGGAIGYFGLDGSINQAITIRSFLSKEQTLYSQAGAGVVIDSVEDKELAEVDHKLGALKKAIQLAQTL